MARESRQVWVKRVERWRDSELTAKEFAAEIGINASRLQHWRWRLNAERRHAGREKAMGPSERLKWVEITSAAKEPGSAPGKAPEAVPAAQGPPAAFEL